MRPEDVEQLSAFMREFQAETDRGAALVGGAMIDDRLLRILKLHFIAGKDANALLEGGSAPLSTFSARIKTCHALGLITPDERDDCDYIRRVRNEFAHKLTGLTFQDNKVQDLCSNLKASQPGELKTARSIFVNATILLSMSLWYRGEYAKEFAAKPRNWSYQLATKDGS